MKAPQRHSKNCAFEGLFYDSKSIRDIRRRLRPIRTWCVVANADATENN